MTRSGDLWNWRGGDFKLYCGNARDAVSYEALLAEERARLVFTDCPYNVRIANNVSGLGKTVHREFFEASGEMSPPEFTTFLRQIFKLLVRFSHGGSIHYHCMDFRHARELLDAADGVYSEFKQLAVWVKEPGMGSFLRNAHELIFIMKAGKDPHINNIGLSGKGRALPHQRVGVFGGCRLQQSARRRPRGPPHDQADRSRCGRAAGLFEPRGPGARPDGRLGYHAPGRRADPGAAAPASRSTRSTATSPSAA